MRFYATAERFNGRTASKHDASPDTKLCGLEVAVAVVLTRELGCDM